MTAVAEMEAVNVIDVEPLDVLTERYRNHLWCRGHEKDHIKTELARLEQAYDLYVDCRQRCLVGGETYTSIGNDIGINRRSVKRYSCGTKPNLLNRIIELEEDNSIIPGREEDKDLAYFIGVLLSIISRQKINPKKGCAYSIIEKDDEALERIDRVCKKYNIPTFDGDKENHICFGYCKTMKSIGDFVDGGGVPWELLFTSEERRESLAGYLDRRSSIYNDSRSSTCLLALDRMETELLFDLTLLFAEVDIFAKHMLKRRRDGSIVEGKGALEVRTKGDFNRLLKTLKSEDKRIQLQRVIAESNEAVVEIGIDQCLEFYGYRKKHPKCNKEKLYARFGVSLPVSKQVTRSITHRAEKYLEVEDLREQRPDIDVIGYCYREIGVSSEAARSLAGVYSMDEIREYDPDTINKWSQIYDEDSSVEVDLERNIMQVVEASIRELANAVINGGTSPAEARESINPIAKASGVPFDRLDDLYWSVYGAALNGHRGEE